ncbi:MAG TPA: cytochrome b [Casimicrobiaceae bacterium]|nr:cytochrome b [Casimicrobiaceae bacterium]
MNGRGHTAEPAWAAPAKGLHWLVAALVLAQFVLGWAAVTWHLSPTKLDLFVWHKSIGMLILALMLLRVGVRVRFGAPPLPHGTPPWERRAAAASHGLLYALVVAMPLSGWVVNSAANIPLRLFWWLPLPPIVAPSKGVETIAAGVHLGFFVALALVIIVHVAAAFRHHFVLRDDVLVRMLPWHRQRA